MTGRNHRGRQLPWREDPAYIALCERIADLRAQGKSLPTVARELKIATSTTYEHWDRWLELVAERAESKAGEHIANLDSLKRRIMLELEDTGKASLNRSALVGQLRAIEMDMAKLDGSLIERKETKLEAEGLTFTLNINAE